MKVDKIFVLYKNTNKLFATYEEAFFNGKKPFHDKTVYYVFTPTMKSYKRVGELERACKEYFNKNMQCDYYDCIGKLSYRQMNLIGEL